MHSIANTMVNNDSVVKFGMLCIVLAVFISISSSTYSQNLDVDSNSAPARSILLQTQLLAVDAHKNQYGFRDPALVDMLVQLAKTQSLLGEYEDAINSLEEALQLSRISEGFYDYSQIDVLDNLIANEILMENWEAVNNYYDLEEHMYMRLFARTDARLEIGLEKVSNWHISAVNGAVDDNRREHLMKIENLLTIRLNIVENLLGSDNARYTYLVNNLEYVQSEIKKINMESNRGAAAPLSSPTPTKTNM